MYWLILLFIVLVGSIMGSFMAAQVWRLRAWQLKYDQQNGERVDSTEWRKLKPLTEKNLKNDHSHCLNCGYKLRWFDLVPIFSWLSLRGKCRNCQKPIGKTELLAELSTAIVFGIIFVAHFSPDNYLMSSSILVGRFVILLIALSLLVILFIYDAKWSLLPSKIMHAFNIVAVVYWLTGFLNADLTIQSLINIIISMLVFPGLYFVLSVVSKGAWVGDGDWILAIGLVLLQPNLPAYSLLLLCLSNFVGLGIILVAASVNKKQLKRGAQIPFGPAMIIAALILLIFQPIVQQIVLFLL